MNNKVELHFLWISSFRNIRNAGFNFSSRGQYYYDHSNNNLNYVENANFISSFFHENITNITGIVGRNGTGKSNVLEFLNYAFRNPATAGLDPFFMIVEEEGVLRVCTYNMREANDMSANINLKHCFIEGDYIVFSHVFFSNVFDNRRNYFADEIIDLSTNKFGWNKYGENIHNYQQQEIRNQIRFINSRHFKKVKNNDLRIPNEIVLSSALWQMLRERAVRVERRHGVEGLTDLFSRYRSRFRDSKSERSFCYFTSFLIFMTFFWTPFTGDDFDESDFDESDFGSDRRRNHLSSDVVRGLNFILREIKDGEFNIKELHYFIIETFGEFLLTNVAGSESLVEFLRHELVESQVEEFVVAKSSRGRHSAGRLEYVLNFSHPSCKSFLNSFFKATGDVTLFNFEWGGISSGEKAFLSLFGRFYSIIRRVRQKNVLICIDEGDLYFHPKWQIEFLSYVINVLPEIFGERNLQIVLSTHSPFLVSDLPKSSLIFLDVDSQGLCSVKESQEIDVETFGGNIHTLYRKTFFLENGTISEFAYQKLKKLQNSILTNDAPDDAQKIINQIGEPLLKMQFEEYFKS